MRLSDAIMMGAATCEMRPGDINSCAFGAALNAQGVELFDPCIQQLIAGQPEENMYDYGPRYLAAIKLWPWIKEGRPNTHADCG